MNGKSTHPRRVSVGLSIFAAAVLASLVVGSAAASVSAITQLKVCGYYSINDTNPTLNLKVLAPGAAGDRGTFVLRGTSANTAVHFTVRRNGTAFTTLTVQTPGSEHIAVTLGPKYRTMNVTLPAGTNVKQTAGCTPR